MNKKILFIVLLVAGCGLGLMIYMNYNGSCCKTTTVETTTVETPNETKEETKKSETKIEIKNDDKNKNKKPVVKNLKKASCKKK
jgi:hypothetical protein